MAALELFKTKLYTDANLVAYWRCEGNSNDSKGSNNGTNTSMSYNASYGKFGQGANFSGSGYISLTNTNFKPGGDFTFTTWLKDSTTGVGQTIWQSYYNIGNPQGWSMEIETTNLIKIVQGDGVSLINNTGGSSVCDGVFHWICGVYDSTTHITTVYVDGSSSWSTSAYALSFNASSNTSFGHRSNTGGDDGVKLTGYQDDSAFFSRKLTAAEITAHWNGTDGLGTGNFFMMM